MVNSTPARTALVTGSTSGIGAATAHKLAAAGWHLIITGRDESRGGAVVEDITTAGGSAVFVPSDLSADPDTIRAFATAATEAAGGHIDALVHNAALCPPVDTVSLNDADLMNTLAVNIRAPHVLTAALVPNMIKRGRGGIVVIGSWMAHVGHPFVGLYSATKAAEIQLARSWAAEFGAQGVRVNTVSPGVTRNPIDASEDAVATSMTEGTPAQRPGTPEEIANAVTWVLSDEATYLHGAELVVDGGITSTR